MQITAKQHIGNDGSPGRPLSIGVCGEPGRFATLSASIYMEHSGTHDPHVPERIDPFANRYHDADDIGKKFKPWFPKPVRARMNSK
jgi:hypothetical protein